MKSPPQVWTWHPVVCEKILCLHLYLLRALVGVRPCAPPLGCFFLFCFFFLNHSASWFKSFLHWSFARNKQGVGNGTNATGADTDRTVQFIRGRNCQWGGWHVFYHVWRGVKVCSKKKPSWGKRGWHKHFWMNKLVKCNERVNTTE